MFLIRYTAGTVRQALAGPVTAYIAAEFGAQRGLLSAQRCAGCGAEHPGLPCDLQDDLFGGGL